MIYTCLSLKDYKDAPYATYVAMGMKPLETRTWKTDYRGPLLIHCSQGSETPNKGKVLCLVDLVAISPFAKNMEAQACCEWYPEAYAWHLENVRIFEPKSSLISPFPQMKGALSLYKRDLLLDNFYHFMPLDRARHFPILDPTNVTGWQRQTPLHLFAAINDNPF